MGILAMAEGGNEEKLRPVALTEESFKAYGQLVGPTVDGVQYGPQDAQLNLSLGIPRLYIMHLERTRLSFKRITHHANVTQCLGSVGGHSWYMAVAPPSIVDPPQAEAQGAVRSKVGHYYLPPSPEDLKVFRVDGPHFIKLHQGTWHAGPLFNESFMDFYNLELSDTNVVDHTVHVFETEFKVED